MFKTLGVFSICRVVMLLSYHVLSIRSVSVLKGPYVLPICNVTVFKNYVILFVRRVEISKLLFIWSFHCVIIILKIHL